MCVRHDAKGCRTPTRVHLHQHQVVIDNAACELCTSGLCACAAEDSLHVVVFLFQLDHA